MKINLKNNKVLITGSSKGIGLVIAKKFLECSAVVTINSSNLKNLKLVRKKIASKNLHTILSDLRSDSNILKLIESANKKMNGIDILICNLGDGKKVKDMGEENYKDWLNSLKINLLSTTSLIFHSKKYLKKSDFPSILCISSICGISSQNAPLDYSSAKAAMISYVKSQSRILSKHKIRINSISPGNIFTKDGRWPEKLKKDKKLKKNILSNVPLNRFGTPEEVAYGAIFLSSSYSSFTTGANLVVDGGQSA